MRTGKLPVEAKLPSVAALMKEFNATEGVVRRALDKLREAGLITSHQGKGSFVRAVPPEPTAEYKDVMQRLDAVQAELRTLAGQVAELRQQSGMPATPAPPAPAGSAKPARRSRVQAAP